MRTPRHFIWTWKRNAQLRVNEFPKICCTVSSGKISVNNTKRTCTAIVDIFEFVRVVKVSTHISCINLLTRSCTDDVNKKVRVKLQEIYKRTIALPSGSLCVNTCTVFNRQNSCKLFGTTQQVARLICTMRGLCVAQLCNVSNMTSSTSDTPISSIFPFATYISKTLHMFCSLAKWSSLSPLWWYETITVWTKFTFSTLNTENVQNSSSTLCSVFH